jgi:hypothetical protein
MTDRPSKQYGPLIHHALVEIWATLLQPYIRHWEKYGPDCVGIHQAHVGEEIFMDHIRVCRDIHSSIVVIEKRSHIIPPLQHTLHGTVLYCTSYSGRKKGQY